MEQSAVTGDARVIAVAAHLDQQRKHDPSYTWVGLEGGRPLDWFDADEQDPAHPGEVRYGIDGHNHGAAALRGEGLAFWNAIMRYVVEPYRKVVEEVCFMPKFYNKGRMIRIHLYDPDLLAEIMPLVEAAAYEAFGHNIAFEEIAPMM